jgi:hypothetical protein
MWSAAVRVIPLKQKQLISKHDWNFQFENKQQWLRANASSCPLHSYIHHQLIAYYTGKNAQVVTNLQQTCSNAVPTTCVRQDVFNRMCSHCLFPACWQVVNGLLTTCCKVVELNRLVTSCSNNLLSSCNSTICQQVVNDNLVATW